MNRLKLLLNILGLTIVLAAAVVYGSQYAPVVMSAPENVETLWEIEDAREESEKPLVTMLQANGVPMAYDQQQNRFFCTLGLENAETWPQLHLTAPGADGVQLIFSDDYTYDWCSDAIREGYAYQVLAYTDTEFSYFEIVFTGLPQIQIETDGREITTEDGPIRIRASAFGEEALDVTARIHLRGASTLYRDKRGYKIEFTRERGGEGKKISLNMPGFGMADDIALLPCSHDDTKIRDKMNWDLWAEIAQDDESFGARTTRYAEVFIDNAYQGIYVIIEPVDMKTELGLSGEGCLMKDSVYRTAALNFSYDREYVSHPIRANAGYELYYAPVGADPFAGIQAFMDLEKEKDDEVFARKAMELIDVDSMLRHFLFIQGCGLTDNAFNNMYIWANQTQDGLKYRFSLWDLDMAWGFEKDEIGEYFENWLFFPVADRMLNLDVGGIRQKAYDMWQEMRTTIFNSDRLEERIASYCSILGDSGALARDAERWNTLMYYPDGYELVNFAELRWPLIDEALEELVSNGGESVEFLEQSTYRGLKGGPIWPAEQ